MLSKLIFATSMLSFSLVGTMDLLQILTGDILTNRYLVSIGGMMVAIGYRYIFSEKTN